MIPVEQSNQDQSPGSKHPHPLRGRRAQGVSFCGISGPTAVLVDGDFFLRRYRQLRGKASPRQVARDLHAMCLAT